MLYLHIFFLMAVNVLRQLCILESMDSRNDQQDGRENMGSHLLGESEM